MDTAERFDFSFVLIFPHKHESRANRPCSRMKRSMPFVFMMKGKNVLKVDSRDKNKKCLNAIITEWL